MDNDWEVQEFAFSGFEWNDEKAEANWRKHGIDFNDAKDAFEGPIIAKLQVESQEVRWRCIGRVNRVEIVVVFTEREYDEGVYCRIISAWPATAADRRRYYAVRAR